MNYYKIDAKRNKNILSVFIRFLKKEKCLDKYMKHLNSNNGYNLREWYYETDDICNFISLDLKSYYGYNLLNRAFRWNETEEGHYFWKDLNSKWKNILCVCFKYLVT